MSYLLIFMKLYRRGKLFDMLACDRLNKRYYTWIRENLKKNEERWKIIDRLCIGVAFITIAVKSLLDAMRSQYPRKQWAEAGCFEREILLAISFIFSEMDRLRRSGQEKLIEENADKIWPTNQIISLILEFFSGVQKIEIGSSSHFSMVFITCLEYTFFRTR